jgi:polyphenol oxidase
VIPWDAPGPYDVVFSTRAGGVSEGPFSSLNLGIFTGDEPDRVVENRRRLCAAREVDPEHATMAWQQHGGEVRRARPESIVDPGLRHDPCDGLWSDEPGQAMLLLTADCLPIALVRLEGERPALAVLHAGWRGLLAGIVPAGVAALGGAGAVAAAVGPAIGPCCYEVRDDVAEPVTAALGPGLVRDGRLDLWEAAERALRAAGVARVERFDLCTSCSPDLFFSHRRDAGVTGRQGVLARVA